MKGSPLRTRFRIRIYIQKTPSSIREVHSRFWTLRHFPPCPVDFTSCNGLWPLHPCLGLTVTLGTTPHTYHLCHSAITVCLRDMVIYLIFIYWGRDIRLTPSFDETKENDTDVSHQSQSKGNRTIKRILHGGQCRKIHHSGFERG